MGETAPERLFDATIVRDVFQFFAEKSRERGILDGLDPEVVGTALNMTRHG